MKVKVKASRAIIYIALFIALNYLVFAAPTGPGTLTAFNSTRRTSGIDNETGGVVVQAQAGNVTALNIVSTSLTDRWQGYYGNITGSITLDDAQSNSLYNWQLASPQGEIYASNGSESGAVTWANTFCFNYTNNLSEGQNRIQRFNGTTIESMIGASASDVDSLRSTFNGTFAGSFQVGSTTISGTSGCRQVTLFVNDAYQSTDFVEVLLTDNNSIIYTSLLEQDVTGFAGTALDFQMIVGENGDVTTPSNYYFFVELS
ncbi:MAG TPA: hypothetical protein VI564_00730 [Candidatus Nanoarchaeia archaeon]|nr:hypothetical protein [Candidatus Nanoarchaeia archaeon]